MIRQLAYSRISARIVLTALMLYVMPVEVWGAWRPYYTSNSKSASPPPPHYNYLICPLISLSRYLPTAIAIHPYHRRRFQASTSTFESATL